MADSLPFQEDLRKPFHISVCDRIALCLTAMSISGGREIPLGIQEVTRDLDLLDKTKVPAKELPSVTKALYGLRVMYGPLMPTVSQRLTQSIDLLVVYQEELAEDGKLDRDLVWLPPVVDPVA